MLKNFVQFCRSLMAIINQSQQIFKSRIRSELQCQVWPIILSLSISFLKTKWPVSIAFVMFSVSKALRRRSWLVPNPSKIRKVFKQKRHDYKIIYFFKNPDILWKTEVLFATTHINLHFRTWMLWLNIHRKGFLHCFEILKLSF